MRNVITVGGCLIVSGVVGARLLQRLEFKGPRTFSAESYASPAFRQAVGRMDAAFAADWEGAHVQPVGHADGLTLIRRLSLALTGTIPSLEEIRAFEAHAGGEPVQWWLTHLFADRRYSDYFAERFARVLVGVENGPFILYRRHRLVSWLSDQFHANRPYDEVVRQLITAQGIWTSEPEANFITVTVDPNNDGEGPDKVKLAGRISKAFLGVRLDCVQCHNDFLGGSWRQSDFHQLAAFFAPSEMSLTGVRDNPTNVYAYRYLGRQEAELVPAKVPFNTELLPADGPLRERLAAWVTHPHNRPFARALVNRVWAMLFNRPLVTPVDSMPLEGPFPPAIEALADDLMAHKFDVQRLIRVIAASRAFQLDSRSSDSEHPVTALQEAHFAAFPLTRLRPEQVAGSVLQSAKLRTIDAESHVLVRITRFFEQNDFVKRYGDAGEDEFGSPAGTIPQRLTLMNGKMVHERTKEDLVANAATRIGAVAPDAATAVETAYLAVLTRRPTSNERNHFVERLEKNLNAKRADWMEDLFWTLLNSTEFSWNH